MSRFGVNCQLRVARLIGKIMRRILKLIAAGHTDHFGDLTTLADESVIGALIARRPHAILQLEAEEKHSKK